MQVWEIGLIKMALFFIGIAVGANWYRSRLICFLYLDEKVEQSNGTKAIFYRKGDSFGCVAIFGVDLVFVFQGNVENFIARKAIFCYYMQ